jgi:hypothetical protein
VPESNGSIQQLNYDAIVGDIYLTRQQGFRDVLRRMGKMKLSSTGYFKSVIMQLLNSASSAMTVTFVVYFTAWRSFAQKCSALAAFGLRL